MSARRSYSWSWEKSPAGFEGLNLVFRRIGKVRPLIRRSNFGGEAGPSSKRSLHDEEDGWPLDNDNERSQVPTTSMPDSGPRSVVDISDKSCEALGAFFRESQGR